MPRSSAQPGRQRAVVDARGVELALPDRQDRDPERVAVEERGVARDIHALDIERAIQGYAPERAIRFGAESAVRLLEEPHGAGRPTVGAAPHERERTPQIASHQPAPRATSWAAIRARSAGEASRVDRSRTRCRLTRQATPARSPLADRPFALPRW